MADTMQFDLVSPERRLLKEEVVSVVLPGADGDLTAMPNHAPVITTLRPGVMIVETSKGRDEYAVTGGFAELGGDTLTVLAERAMPCSDLDQETFDALVSEAEDQYRKAKDNFVNEPGPVDDAAKLLSDMVAMGTHVGLSTRQPNL
jgi:F-type H+-transporting ATPase subunit epsilon